MTNRAICAHTGCGCPVNPKRDITVNGLVYCSQYCAQRGFDPTDECQCPHSKSSFKEETRST